MIQTTIDLLKNYQFNNTIAIYTYWIPLVVCLVVYLFRFLQLYRDDLRESDSDYYHPRLTVGYILGHLFLAIAPVINLFALVFDCFGSIFGYIRSFLLFLDKIFNIPLVPKPSKKK
jgi:hypothetical protein